MESLYINSFPVCRYNRPQKIKPSDNLGLGGRHHMERTANINKQAPPQVTTKSAQQHFSN